MHTRAPNGDKIETGTRFLYDRELLLLSDVFGVPLSTLLGGGEL